LFYLYNSKRGNLFLHKGKPKFITNNQKPYGVQDNQSVIMTLRFLNTAPSYKVKAQIHKTGKLGFSLEAIRRFKFNNTQALMFAVDDEANQDEFFALVVPKDTPGSFPLMKVGLYYIVPSPTTFNMLGYKYKEELYIFNIEEVIHDGQAFLKFARRSPIGSNYKNK